MVPVPSNIITLIGTGGDGGTAVIEKIVNGQTDVKTNIQDLGWYWPVHIWFSQPVWIHRITRRVWRKDPTERFTRVGHKEPQNIEVTDYIFRAGFFISGSIGEPLCYQLKRRSRRGFRIPIDLITKYEPVLERKQYDH